MGRRALRKPPDNVDFSWHLLPLDELPPSGDREQLFRRSAPLEVEVGSGKGLFLSSAAAAHPERNFLGIEIATKYAQFIAARLAKQQVPNARVVHGDAERMFREYLPNNATRAVHIYFPDPWWKTRHHKRRIMNERFLSDVARVLRQGGRLHFWTDVADYFRASIQVITAHTPLIGPLPVAEQTPAHDLDYRTHFERRTRLEELPVYRAEFQKPPAAVAEY